MNCEVALDMDKLHLGVRTLLWDRFLFEPMPTVRVYMRGVRLLHPS